ncbi:DUF169 domain-containing protein [Methanosarcina sp.]|jgi:uncharacterized protein (DUF169 family)|uniref:DUF169 domain-containing protein n=1 Tax=Methanosarcina sp. TaxID=2213 RepID=UPI002CDD46C9|nr:DUF169 domain-containing protein [Methanosarcina sp.]HOW15771.1 DUF169 domain-containing protein [Methanosarcina sp.]
MQKEDTPFSRYPELKKLMETGEPVCITFETQEGNTKERLHETVLSQKTVPFQGIYPQGISPEEKIAEKGIEEPPRKSDFLFCELVQKARMGEKFRISGQSCSPGDYVLGLSEKSPAEYYLRSGRYIDKQAAEKAALSLPRLKRKFCSILIEPLSLNKGIFDVLILFLKPERAMRVVQANAYSGGKRTLMDTMGAASICGDCTVLALEQGMSLSFGCKGSRKHSGYGDFEVPLGMSFEKIEEIEEGLSKLPETSK